MGDSDSTHPRRRRRGPVPLDAADRRNHCVSVRLNEGELSLLDSRRGRHQRGEWLRIAALDVLPPVIPEINSTAWAVLATAVANLNQYQAAINKGQAHAIPSGVLDSLRDHVQALRLQLICAYPDVEDPDEGNAED